MAEKDQLGTDFIWGTSISAFQTEGVYKDDGRGPSIWDEFLTSKRRFRKAVPSLNGTNFLKHYAQDLSFLEWMNCSNFRFSFSWPRIFPEGVGQTNQKGVDFYHRLIDNCLEREIVPWVTIYHWDLPAKLQRRGGWTNRDVLFWMEEYIAFCIKEYGDRVKNWMVLNEPMAFTALGYFLGIHAPGKKGLKNFLPAIHHASLVQAQGAQLIKSLDSKLKVGSTFSFSHIEPKTDKSRDRKAALKVDALLNRLFLEPLLGLGYPLEVLSRINGIEKYILDGDVNKLKANLDFIGVQNYSREIIRHSYFTPIVNAKLVSAQKRKVEQTQMGWEVFPESIYHVLKKLNQYENIPPLIITENGAAFWDEVKSDGRISDKKRIDFLKGSIQAIARAKKEGVNLGGYFIWSLTDNLEWAEGYKPRFGLIYVDYESQKRIPKGSAFWFKEFLSSTD